jgi:hypothetical protein
VTELAARAVVPKVDAAVDGDDAADPRPERQSDHRRGTARRPQAQLGQAEGARVVDQRRRQPERRTDGAGNGPPRPGPRDVDKEPGGAGGRVVQPRDPDPDRGDARVALDGLGADRRQAGHDRVGAVGGRRRDLAPVEDPPLAGAAGAAGIAGVMFDDHPFDVGAAEIEAQMAARWRLVHHDGQVSAVTRV